MTAPTPQVTNRERQVWWWVAGAALVVVLLVAAIVLAGGEDDTVAQVEPSPTGTPTPTVAVQPTPTPEPSPTGEPEPESATPPDSTSEREAPPESEPESDALALPGATYGPFSGGSTPPVGGSWIADVRSAGHDGYDRVVVEFDGAVVPTYTVAYTVTSGPFHDTPGNVVPIEGEAFLDVWLQGTSRVDMTDDYAPVYTGPTRLRTDTTTVTEVVEIEDFEANVHWLIGLDERAEFVVWTLDSPSRLVIDIAV
jgi:hypothetical protein